jgi:hypothetical protein
MTSNCNFAREGRTIGLISDCPELITAYRTYA